MNSTAPSTGGWRSNPACGIHPCAMYHPTVHESVSPATAPHYGLPLAQSGALRLVGTSFEPTFLTTLSTSHELLVSEALLW